MKKIISLLLALTVSSTAAVGLTGCKLFDRLTEGETLRVILLGEKPEDFDEVKDKNAEEKIKDEHFINRK